MLPSGRSMTWRKVFERQWAPRRGGGGAAGTGEARQALPAGKGSPAGVVRGEGWGSLGVRGLRGEEAWGAARPPQAGKRPEAA